MAANSSVDFESSFTSIPSTQGTSSVIPSTQDFFTTSEPGDLFLTVQRSAVAVSKIYNELFAKSRSEFISKLSGFCCIAELRFARDMVYSIAKRKIGNNNLGRLTKRRSGANVKNNLLKDIYNLYSLGDAGRRIR